MKHRNRMTCVMAPLKVCVQESIGVPFFFLFLEHRNEKKIHTEGVFLYQLEQRCLPQLLPAPLTSPQRLQSTSSSCILQARSTLWEMEDVQAGTTILNMGTGVMEMLTVFQS